MSEGQSVSGQPSAALSTPSRLRELLNAATPGPWARWFSEITLSDWVGSDDGFRLADVQRDGDAELIVAMFNALPALLDCVDALERTLTYCGDHHEYAQVKEFARHALDGLKAGQ